MNKHSKQNLSVYHCNSTSSATFDTLKGICDSGSSRYYTCINAHCTNIQPAGSKTVTITFSNNKTTKSTHIGLLPYQNLPLKARLAHIFPELKNKILISLEQLCDSNMKIMLNKTTIKILQNNDSNTVILEGCRSPKDSMWYLDMQYTPHEEV